ncbi:hypothetical protein QE364_003881 [Nocardioides zeae]|uniref:Uncharacterized protein n=2 Tax=Nocardioides zeae TaxID=1457234 RepID=A0ACC6IN32_9ACTN|nr:DUF4375 domain-containing protein [Nocardioides zeae]MDQ1105925.1 hypothetical protein [Nocardioides zeae]MDR6174429.1 hypothetical protein [Nocardioides zeae]MDR6212150.1 hypothetical protein [Nocardioides zeae]
MVERSREKVAVDFWNECGVPRDALEDAADRERWDLGALVALVGVAGNGGLLGMIENNRETSGPLVADALTALRSLGLTDAADLVARAEAAYLVMRPNDCSDDLTEEQEELWDELDEAWWPVGEEIERVVDERLAALG